MKGVRFYEEFVNLPKTKREGNCLAVLYGNISPGNYFIECVAPVYGHPNSQCASSQTTPAYLREHCKRVSEARAREIHPALFRYLEQGGQS